jgi:hypothetical protein
MFDRFNKPSAELAVIEAQEVAKRADLAVRKKLLADRLQHAYDSDRTSMLETFLSGGTFTDLLAEMSYYIDVGEQDKALASEIARDQETLAALHQATEDTRVRTDELRRETAAQKRALDKNLVALNEAKAALRVLEKRTAAVLAEQKRTYQRLARNKAAAAAIIAKAAADQKKLAKTISGLIAKQVMSGRIPSKFNGTMRWPMDSFTISGNYGCSSFEYYAPVGGRGGFATEEQEPEPEPKVELLPPAEKADPVVDGLADEVVHKITKQVGAVFGSI